MRHEHLRQHKLLLKQQLRKLAGREGFSTSESPGANLVFEEIAAALLRVIDQIRFTLNTEGNSVDTEGEYDDN